MGNKFAQLAKLARERYQENKGFDMTQSNDRTIVAPPTAKKAKYLKDADGNLYLWTEELAQRGDLVAAYDPDAPDKYAGDFSQIALNRELEMARDRADAEEVARLEAVKQAELAEAAKLEAEELARANAENLRLAEAKLQAEREENAKKLAEMQAKIDALAKENATGKAKENDKPTGNKRKPTKKVVEKDTAADPDSENPVDEF